MNAPWNSGRRAPFAAYACDDVTLDTARDAANALGWATEACHKGNLRDAIQALAVSASPAILLIDLSDCADPLKDIGELAEVCEPGTVVIALGKTNDVRLYRDLIASGLHDYLLKPVSERALREALEQAHDMLSTPRGDDGEAAHRHVTATVIGTRGGVGASTVATSLAWLFGDRHALSTALLDLDIHFGVGALTLDLEPGRGLTDAIENPGRIDGLFIERAMIRANDRLAILSAEAPISQPLMTDGAAFAQLESEFRQAFDVTVIDMPRNMLINFPQLIAETNVAIVVTELTLAGARDAIRILSWLRTHAPQAVPVVVANKVNGQIAELTRSDFETSIETGIDCSIPLDAKATAGAAKLGQVLVDAAPQSKAGIAIADLAQRVLGAGNIGGGVVAKKKSLLETLGLSALVSGKRAKAGPAG